MRMRSNLGADGVGTSPAFSFGAGASPAYGEERVQLPRICAVPEFQAREIPDGKEDQDDGDVVAGVDEDAMDADELDTDRVASNEAPSTDS